MSSSCSRRSAPVIRVRRALAGAGLLLLAGWYCWRRSPRRQSCRVGGSLLALPAGRRYASVRPAHVVRPAQLLEPADEPGAESRAGPAAHRAARDVGSAWCRLCQDSPQDRTASHHTLPERSRDLKGRLPTAWQIELIDHVTWCSSATRTSEPQKNAGERAPPGHRHQTADQRRASPARAIVQQQELARDRTDRRVLDQVRRVLLLRRLLLVEHPADVRPPQALHQRRDASRRNATASAGRPPRRRTCGACGGRPPSAPADPPPPSTPRRPARSAAAASP